MKIQNHANTLRSSSSEEEEPAPLAIKRQVGILTAFVPALMFCNFATWLQLSSARCPRWWARRPGSPLPWRLTALLIFFSSLNRCLCDLDLFMFDLMSWWRFRPRWNLWNPRRPGPLLFDFNFWCLIWRLDGGSKPNERYEIQTLLFVFCVWFHVSMEVGTMKVMKSKAEVRYLTVWAWSLYVWFDVSWCLDGGWCDESHEIQRGGTVPYWLILIFLCLIWCLNGGWCDESHEIQSGGTVPYWLILTFLVVIWCLDGGLERDEIYESNTTDNLILDFFHKSQIRQIFEPVTEVKRRARTSRPHKAKNCFAWNLYLQCVPYCSLAFNFPDFCQVQKGHLKGPRICNARRLVWKTRDGKVLKAACWRAYFVAGPIGHYLLLDPEKHHQWVRNQRIFLFAEDEQ